MKLYINKAESCFSNAVAVDDMILTKELPTTAGSKMLDGYKSLFAAQVVERVISEGYQIAGKANVGEFSIDMLGESSYFGCCSDDSGNAFGAAAGLVAAGDVKAALCLDVNGAPRRAAALSGMVCVKPTYGTVSRYGTIPVACSGETVTVTARSAGECREILDVIAGHDDKDGTSLPEEKCALVRGSSEAKPLSRVAVIKTLADGVDSQTSARINAFKEMLVKNGAEVVEIE